MTAPTAGVPFALRLAGIARATAAVLSAWCRRHRTRQQLGGLDARQLRDLGITEADRRQECAKWFWQL